MKQYLLSMDYPQGATQPPREALERIMREVHQIRRDLEAAGSWVFAGGLTPANSATVVQFKNGDTLTIDGPYAEAKEHIGGVTVIRVADLDSALGWARRYSQATGLPIEVRPFQDEGAR